MAVLKYMRWLSMHIALGVICVLYFVDRLQEINLPLSVYLSIFTAVWAIYLLDHLQDAGNTVISNPRRIFHRERAKSIRLLLALNLLAGFVSVFFLPISLLLLGAGLAGLIVLYLVWSNTLGSRGLKELSISVLYALGVFLAPLLFGDFWVSTAMMCQLAGLAFANLVVFSLYEEQWDREEGFSSMVTILGSDQSRQVLRVIFSALLISGIVFLITGMLPWRYQMFVLVGTLTLAGLSLRPDLFGESERYRIMGDFVFIIPLALLG